MGDDLAKRILQSSAFPHSLAQYLKSRQNLSVVFFGPATTVSKGLHRRLHFSRADVYPHSQ